MLCIRLPSRLLPRSVETSIRLKENTNYHQRLLKDELCGVWPIRALFLSPDKSQLGLRRVTAARNAVRVNSQTWTLTGLLPFPDSVQPNEAKEQPKSRLVASPDSWLETLPLVR